MALQNKTLSTIEELSSDWLEKYIKDARACHKSIVFEHLSRGQLIGVYFGMAAGIIIVAGAAGVIYSNTEKEYSIFRIYYVAFKSKKHPSEEDRQELKIKKKQLKRDAKRCLWKTFGCLVVAIVCDIFQVLAIIALQHCHHEDLLGLYWPLWTLLGLGSTIAMVGVCINQAYGLLEQDLPPFGTALGTPVLVVCAIIHLIWNLSKDKLKKLKRKSDKNLETEDLEKTITEVSARSTACNALSVLLEDGPVLQFWSSNKPHPPNAKVVGMLGDIVILDYKCPCRNGPHRFRTCSSRRSSVPSAAQAEASTQTAPDETL